MFKPLAVYIGLRYNRAKRGQFFISFISLVSVIGIVLGVATLITVLSVMNGFDREISQRIFGMSPQVTVSTFSGAINDWKPLQQRLSQSSWVESAAPYISGLGLITDGAMVQAAYVTGIDPMAEKQVSDLPEKMVEGHLGDLKAGKFSALIGQGVAQHLRVSVGDKINLMVPKALVTPAGVIPRYKRFTIAGIFAVGPGFKFDNHLIFIHLQDAQKLFQMHQAISGIRLKVEEVYQAPYIAEQIAHELTPEYVVNNWTQEFGAFFKALKMEKTMMFLIVFLIIAVAAFNLVSSLVMLVNEKQADIAILRTMGTTPKTIMAIFLVQGSLLGGMGTLLGLGLGVLIASHVTTLVNTLQSWLNMEFLSSNVYFINYLPSEILPSDLMIICLVTLSMSFLATLYPAWRASRVHPAQALRYE